MQERGKPRGVGFVIVLTIVTLGIYSLYWLWVTFAEVKRWRGEGVNGFVGLLLSIVVVGYFLLPSYVGRMYKADGVARGEDPLQAADNVPITGWSGLFILIPWIGSLIWMARVQGKLNDFWEGQEIRSTAGAPPVTA